MREQTLQTQIQDIVDEAINRIHALTRQWIIQEVEATFEGAETKPKKSSKKATKGKKGSQKQKRQLSPEAKANLMKNLRKAWTARSKQAAELRAQKEKEAKKKPSSRSTKKKQSRPTRKPASKKK